MCLLSPATRSVLTSTPCVLVSLAMNSFLCHCLCVLTHGDMRQWRIDILSWWSLRLPCVLQFGKQEPADNPDIKKFAEGKGFTGPVFAKIDVNGPTGPSERHACPR